MGIPLTLSSVPATTPYIQYVSTNGQTVFPYPFPITQDSDLVVVINGVTQPTDGGYSLSGQGNPTGGNVTFTSGQTTGAIITLFRDVAIQRISQIAQNSGFSSTVFNAEFNNIYLIMQQLQESIALCLQIPNTNNPAPTTSLLPANYANKYLAFDANGNPTPALLTSSGSLTQAIIGGLLNQQTPAEVAAGITPANYAYAEGDIRRYGALTSNSDNSTAINNALLVSANSGAAAYVPGGLWLCTHTLNCVPESSMHGAGPSSVLSFNTCNGLTFPLDSSASTHRRVFRDFAIVGVNGNTFAGLYCNAAPSAAWNITFQNIDIQQFTYAVYAAGFRECLFTGINIFNVYQGFYFNGQSTNCHIVGCEIVRGTFSGAAGGAYGVYCAQAGGLTPEGIYLTNDYIFGFDIGVNVPLVNLMFVDNCDISNCLITGVQLTGVVELFTLTGSWIQLTTNSVVGIGINLPPVTPNTQQKVVIANNYVQCDDAITGSTGMAIGNGWNGTLVSGNEIFGFDHGIQLGAANGSTFRDNMISITASTNGSVYSATSYTIQLTTTLIQDLTIGPNYIVPGTKQAATMANASANIGVTSSASFPVGTPVQFDASQNGFQLGVTYFVISSAANVITVGAVAGGSAITATGNTAVNVFASPLPVTYAIGPPSIGGYQLFARMSFIGLMTGFSPPVSGRVDVFANGYQVFLNLYNNNNLSGTSNTTTMTCTNLPSPFVPATTQNFLAQVVDSGSNGYGVCQVSTAGLLTFFKQVGGGAFTASGTKAWAAMSTPFSIN